MSDEFVFSPDETVQLPLLLGVAGPTGSGKTFSALRMATGMQRVTGGEIALIDTEARRGTAYRKFFQFRHVDFPPPFGPLRYIKAIDFCLNKGVKNIIVDSMTHEHSGPGGVMEQINDYLDKKCGDDYGARERMNMLAHKQPKADRKELNNFIIQAGRGGVNFIFCYRADEKVKPVKGEGIVNMGMTPETTSKLVYEMMALFLLTSACDGRPNLKPSTNLERMLTKLPLQFRELLVAGEPLSEDLGQKLAEWAKGTPAEKPARPTDELVAAGDAMAVTGSAPLQKWWTESLSKAERQLLKGKIDGWKEIAGKVA